jgi:hypothetical protein
MVPPEQGQKGKGVLMEVKASYDRLQTFMPVALDWRERHSELTLAGYAMDKVLAQLPAIDKKIQVKLNDEDVEHCLTEKRGDNEVITRDKHKLLEFTKATITDRNNAHREILERPDITVQVRFAKRIPKGMSELELKIFQGLVFDKETVKAELARREAEVEELERKEDEAEQKAQAKPAAKTTPVDSAPGAERKEG